LEILKFLAGISGSLVHEQNNPEGWHAAKITPESQAVNRPSINDVLEILKYLAGLTTLVVVPQT
jgi:hypothetical protein